MVVLEEELERTSKYLKRWVKRFVSFNDKTCHMSYGTSKYRIKRSMLVTKVTRITASPSKLASLPSSYEIFAVRVEGVSADGEHQTWSIRMPDKNSFTLWIITLRNSLSQPGTFSSARFVSSVAPSPFKERLETFYQKHAPDQLVLVDKLLSEYKGQEEKLFEKLNQQFHSNAAAVQAADTSSEQLGSSVALVASHEDPAIPTQRASISSVPEDFEITSMVATDELFDDIEIDELTNDSLDSINIDEI